MNTVRPHNIQVVQDKQLAIAVMKSVGEWMREIGAANAKWWQPDILDNDEQLATYADDESFFALTVDDEPAAMVLTPNALDDWSSVDGNEHVPALHLGWVTTARPFRGQGLVANLVAFAQEYAKSHNVDRLRLDTNACEPKLCNTYARCGFTLIAEVPNDDRITALFEKRL